MSDKSKAVKKSAKKAAKVTKKPAKKIAKKAVKKSAAPKAIPSPVADAKPVSAEENDGAVAGETVANLFKMGREKREWSVRAAAKELGISSGHLSDIEAGKHTNVTCRLLLKLRTVYAISPRRIWPALELLG